MTNDTPTWVISNRSRRVASDIISITLFAPGTLWLPEPTEPASVCPDSTDRCTFTVPAWFAWRWRPVAVATSDPKPSWIWPVLVIGQRRVGHMCVLLSIGPAGRMGTLEKCKKSFSAFLQDTLACRTGAQGLSSHRGCLWSTWASCARHIPAPGRRRSESPKSSIRRTAGHKPPVRRVEQIDAPDHIEALIIPAHGGNWHQSASVLSVLC
jgi:hypothetical protein